MAPTCRNEDPALEKPKAREAGQALRDEPFAFDFFQAVRLLCRLLPERTPVGRFANPEDEAVRFGASTDMGFPPGQIAKVEWPDAAQPRMDVHFMGLTGPLGALPLYYSALLRERLRAGDGAMRAFFDLFNHRALSLFYRAWEKHHFTAGYERGEQDPLSPHIMDLMGLGTAGLSARQTFADEAFMFRCGLFSLHTRSAAGLRALIIDYFDVPVEIEQFVGQWRQIDMDTQCRLDDEGSDSGRLGIGAVVGDEIWDRQSGVRIRLGPLTLDGYREFLPDGAAYRSLRALVRFYAGNELDCEAQLVLKRDEVPYCELGLESVAAPRLGLTAWAATRPLEHDPDDSIIPL
jgi:type VI secretion system protein ImpH